MFILSRVSTRTAMIAVVLLFLVFAGTLYVMGQVPICTCGYVKLWHGIVASSENSQHLFDWYSFSHVIHGFIFYAFFWLFRRWIPLPLRLLLAVVIEMAWEIFENTDYVINRYREVTISRDYYGDSIINSSFDVIAMLLGFVIAWRAPIWLTAVLLVFMEAFVGFWIRDNLTLNILMLLYPVEWIRVWQAGG
jgi:hypothetical protein